MFYLLLYMYLLNNHISDIKVFGKVKFKKLEFLDLSRNKITNFEVLKKIILKN